MYSLSTQENITDFRFQTALKQAWCYKIIKFTPLIDKPKGLKMKFSWPNKTAGDCV